MGSKKRRFCYSTDVGGVYVGVGWDDPGVNDGFAFIIPNGYGDGDFGYTIYEDSDEWDARRDAEDTGKPVSGQWRFFTSFETQQAAWVTGGAELCPGWWAAWSKDGDLVLVYWEKY